MEKVKHIGLLLFMCSVLFFTNLGEISLWNNNEPRYAHVARNMIETGDYITPKLKGKIRVDKPPLTYWLIVASAKLLDKGNVTEFTARLPFAVCGILCVIIVYFTGNLLFPYAGLLSALFLISTNEFLITARRAIPDMALCFFITLAMYFFLLGYKRSDKYYLLAWISAAFAFLTKGPVGVIIPFLTILSFLLVKGELHELKKMKPLTGLAVSAFIILPWFLAVGWNFCEKFFLLHNFKHFSKGLDHRKPWYFYFTASIFPYAPPILFLPAGIWVVKREAKESSVLLPFIWFLTTFLLFSMAAAKRVVYLLPIAPALSLIAGISTAKFFERKDRILTVLFNSAVVLTILGISSSPFISLIVRYKIAPVYWILALIPAFYLFFFFKNKNSKEAINLMFIFIFTAYFIYFGKILPEYDEAVRSAKPLAKAIITKVDGSSLYRYGPYDAALEFYLERPFIPKIRKDEMNKLCTGKREFFVVMRKKYFNKLKNIPPFKLVLVMRNREKEFVLLKFCGEN